MVGEARLSKDFCNDSQDAAAIESSAASSSEIVRVSISTQPDETCNSLGVVLVVRELAKVHHMPEHSGQD